MKNNEPVLCSCGCGREVPQNNRNTIKRTMHPNCQLKAAMKKSKVKQSSFATGKKNNLGKSNIDKQLDNTWSLLVKLRADNKCEFCGNRQSLNAHHIFSRSKNSVRWDVENGISLCVNHHIGVMFSAHKSPMEFTLWIIEYRGKIWYHNLLNKAHSTAKYHEFEKELILNELRTEIEKLNNE